MKTHTHWLNFLTLALLAPSLATAVPSKLRWIFPLPGAETVSTPVIAQQKGIVYVSTDNNMLWAVDLVDGQRKGNLEFKEHKKIQPALALSLDESTVYTVGKEQNNHGATGFLAAIKINEPQLNIWREINIPYALETQLSNPIVDSAGKIFVRFFVKGEGPVVDPDAYTQKTCSFDLSHDNNVVDCVYERFSINLYEVNDFPQRQLASNTTKSGVADILGYESNAIYYVVDIIYDFSWWRPRAPLTLWESQPVTSPISSPAVDHECRLIYTSSQAGTLYAYEEPEHNSSEASPLWTRKVADADLSHSAPVVAKEGTIYLSGTNGYLYAVAPDTACNPYSQHLFRLFVSPNGLKLRPALDQANNILYLVDNDGGLFAVELHPEELNKTKILWYVSDARAVTTPIIASADGTVVVNSVNADDGSCSLKAYAGGRR